MVAILPILSDWLENSYQVSAQDLVLPLLLNTLTATLVTILFFKGFTQNRLVAYCGSIFSTILLANGFSDRLHAIYPFLKALNPIIGSQKSEETIIGLLFLFSSFAWD
jgi:hypothetical protein